MGNYIVSARKYRPDTFDSVVAQKALTTTLKNAIRSGKLAHAYLFCGPRGVGKTTCARIFAKTINCEHLTAAGEPCNECESCRSFNEQRSYSIYELDAASNNSVEDIRSLNEQVRIPPQIGHYKVYIIDEVHMLSQAAFNAFLKTLEEPPAHAIFILATTEKHKIIPTILSRCQIYDFSRIESADIISHLHSIAVKEGINTEHEALRIIAQKSDGCMRDALSLFDQMVSFTQGDLTYSKVIDSLNVLDYEYYFRFTDYILSGNVSQALLLFNDILNRGFEGNIFIDGLASHFRDLLVSSDAVTMPLFEGSEELGKRYSSQASQCASKWLFKALKLCNDCSMNYRMSRNKRLLAELTIIQLSQLNSSDENDDASGRKPGKLKPIFKKLHGDDSAVQVTQSASASVPEVHRKNMAAEKEAHKAVPQSASVQNVMQGRPESLKTQSTTSQGALGRMFQGVRNSINNVNSDIKESVSSSSPTVRNEVSDAVNKPAVTQDVLTRQWFSFAMKLPENEHALADRMKIIVPALTGEDTFSISVDNQLVAEMFEKEAARIAAGMEPALGARMKMSINVNEVVTRRHVYDRTKQFEILREKNPVIEKLRQALNLDLS